MTKYLGVAPVVRGMLERAGIEAFDIAPSAKDVPNPIVVCNERYVQTDALEDCEYGITTLDVIAVRETKSECFKTIADVIYVLHKADWEPWCDGRISIRGLTIPELPDEMPRDASGRWRMKVAVTIEMSITR